MKICLYSPYFPDHFGGGEKYILDIALVLAQKHQVYLGINKRLSKRQKDQLRKDYQSFMGRSLVKIKLIYTPLGTNTSWWRKLIWTKKFACIYYLTDGSLFFSLAKKNILHIQFPLRLSKRGLVDRLKLANWQVKNTNSFFTKQVVETAWPTKIDLVHHPLVDTQEINLKPAEFSKKKPIILNVGRFFSHLHSKKQAILIQIFKQLIQKYPKASKGWKLVLIGSIEDQRYTDEIHQLAAGLPVVIHHQLDRQQLIDWYKKTSIYWHATGYGVDAAIEPEKVEHFGISTAEAMAAGCAPVVIGKGGQLEVLGDKLQPWLWTTKSDCLHKTVKLMKDAKLLSQVQHQAIEQAQQFNRSRFEAQLWRMIGT